MVFVTDNMKHCVSVSFQHDDMPAIIEMTVQLEVKLVWHVNKKELYQDLFINNDIVICNL